MQLMQWQEHTRWSNPSLSNSNKATNAYGGIREEEQRKSTNESPRTRSTKFPSLRGGMDWWKCGSRSPLTFPSKICKNHRREWKREKLSKVNNGGERGGKRAWLVGEEGGVFIPLQEIFPFVAVGLKKQEPDIPVQV